MRKYIIIDYFRIIAALMVIGIHTSPFNSLSKINIIFGYINFFLVQVLFRIAVPFFFTITGYFLYKNNTFSDSFRVKKTLIKLIKLYCIWSFLYFIYIISDQIIYDLFNIDSLLILVKNFLLSGIFLQLWYLNAIIVVIYLTNILLKKMDFVKILFISILLFIIGIFADSYYYLIPMDSHLNTLRNIYESIFITTRNGLFFGMLFFNLGGLIDRIKIKYKFKIKLLIASFLMLTLEVFILEYFDLSKDYNMMIFLIPVSFFLISVLLEYKKENHKDILNKTLNLRDLSFLVFAIHPIPIIFMNYYNDHINSNSTPFYSLIIFITTTIFSFVISGFLLKLSTFKYFKFINFLY